ncbi:hypothetical protein D9M68_674180 [compost metagenome]
MKVAQFRLGNLFYNFTGNRNDLDFELAWYFRSGHGKHKLCCRREWVRIVQHIGDGWFVKHHESDFIFLVGCPNRITGFVFGRNLDGIRIIRQGWSVFNIGLILTITLCRDELTYCTIKRNGYKSRVRFTAHTQLDQCRIINQVMFILILQQNTDQWSGRYDILIQDMHSVKGYVHYRVDQV